MTKRTSQRPVTRIDSEVTRCVRQHARAHMKTEVCGVLIGEKHEGVVQVQASIEALNAAQAGTHVTFTPGCLGDHLQSEGRVLSQ